MRILKRLYKIFMGEDIKMLERRGLVVGRNLQMQRDCVIDRDHCFLITIGNDVTLAPRVHILAHDASTKKALGYTKIGLVKIGNNVFVGAGSIILPNVTIGDDCIVGAGSVVTKSFPAGMVIAGNPARAIGTVADYLERQRQLMKEACLYDESWTIRKNMSSKQKQIMKEALEEKRGFVE